MPPSASTQRMSCFLHVERRPELTSWVSVQRPASWKVSVYKTAGSSMNSMSLRNPILSSVHVHKGLCAPPTLKPAVHIQCPQLCETAPEPHANINMLTCSCFQCFHISPSEHGVSMLIYANKHKTKRAAKAAGNGNLIWRQSMGQIE